MTPVTHDSISLRGAGIITISQPTRGHRFTLDSMLLADFCRVRPNERVLEPGAGTGVVSIALAKKHPRSRFTALEMQPHLCGLCAQNCKANDVAQNVTAILGDLRFPVPSLRPSGFDVIVANPPYTRSAAGRTSPLPERRAARQDQCGGIGAWLDLHKLLKNGGRYVVIFPAARQAELVSLMRDRELAPKRIRFVHPFRDKPASRVLVEAQKAAKPGLTILPPLTVHNDDNAYSTELRSLYGLFEVLDRTSRPPS